LIGTEECPGFCGRCVKAETPQERMRRGGSAHPLGKRAFWSGNQLTRTEVATMYMKTDIRKVKNPFNEGVLFYKYRITNYKL